MHRGTGERATSGRLVAAVIALWAALSAPAAAAGEPRPERRDLYLASRDEIHRVLRILDDVPEAHGGTFIGIVGGLAALNFIERLQPADVLLVDLNPAQVEYGRCVLALIKAAPTRAAFVTALFSRPFQSDEAAFLRQPGDRATLEATTHGIGDPALRASCRADLALIADATWDAGKQALRVSRNTNGTYLQLRGPDKGMPRGFNFLYYDRGWLASDATYARTRAALGAARVRFLVSDVGAIPLDDIRGRDIFFWGTNLATWFEAGKAAYERFVVRAHEVFAARDEAIRFVFTSTYRRPAWTDFVPFERRDPGVHLDVSAKVRKHTEGKRVLELIGGKGYFGRELRAAEVAVRKAAEPLDPAARYDVAVLHILNNSGIRWWRGDDRASAFRALYEGVLTRAGEVVVVEHNRSSADFDERERARMVGFAELLAPLFPLLAKRSLALTVELAIGHTDHARNLVLDIKKR